MSKGSVNGGFWWERGMPNPMKGRKLKAPEEYAPKQTYANYHKAYFESEHGKEVLKQARQRYHDKLRAKWGVGIVNAQRLERESKARHD